MRLMMSDARNLKELPLAVIGVDYKTACSTYRGDLTLSDEERAKLFQSIRNIDPAAGLAVLETCNRVEWIVSTEQPAWMADLLTANIVSRWRKSQGDLLGYPRPAVYVGEPAAEHIFRVVSGLESFVRGEAQISGQFHRAMIRARKEGTASDIINKLAGIAGRVSRKSGRIGFQNERHGGIHTLVLRFLESHFGAESKNRNIAVVGMGEIGRKTAQMLEEAGGMRVTRVNRTVGEKNKDVWRSLSEIAAVAEKADALIVATGGRAPVLTLRNLDPSGRAEPLVIVDIGIPRQLSMELQESPLVEYHPIDDLMRRALTGGNRDLVTHVEDEVREHVAQFRRYCMERDLTLLLDRTRARHDEYSRNIIPAFLSEHLAVLDEHQRGLAETELRRMFRAYTNDVFESVHAVVDKFASETHSESSDS